MQPHTSRSLYSLISFFPQSCHTHHLFLNYPYKGLLHNHPTRTSISSLLILISLGDHYPFQASFGLFLYRNLLPSFNLSAMMPPRPSNLNCYKNLSIWYAIYATSTSTLRCLLGHLFLYNFQRLLLGSLFSYRFHLQIPSRQSFSYSWATPSRQYTIGLLFISPSHALSISLFNSISSPSNFKGSPPACPLHWIRWLRLYHSLFGPLAIPYRIINFHHL